MELVHRNVAGVFVLTNVVGSESLLRFRKVFEYKIMEQIIQLTISKTITRSTKEWDDLQK